jgi:hypothetical protein
MWTYSTLRHAGVLAAHILCSFIAWCVIRDSKEKLSFDESKLYVFAILLPFSNALFFHLYLHYFTMVTSRYQNPKI